MATLSLLGLYNYDPTILDGLQVPDGVDRDSLISNLLLETAELEILYPEPDTMSMAIRAWSTKELPIWTKLQATTEFDYNPIWNVDGTETEERDLTYTDQTAGDSVGSVTGYNEDEFAPANRAESSSTGNRTDKGTITHTRGGNIGVTSTQSLIQQEREVDLFSVQDHIINSFKQRFCLLVY